MAVPKRKTSTSRRNKRRSHHRIVGANVIEDKKSGEYRLSHHIDLKTGTYNGKKNFRQIVLNNKSDMLEKVKISIDVMGGDNSPYKTLEGINLFIKRNQNINDYVFYLFGDETIINQKLSNFKYLKNNYKIFDTKIVVTMNYLQCLQSKKAKIQVCGKPFNHKSI